MEQTKSSIDKLDGTKGYKLTNNQDMKESVVDEHLTFILTEADFAEKGKEAGRVAGELRKTEFEFDKIKKEWKEKIEDREMELSKIHGTIREGKESRKVKCIKQMDYKGRMVRWIFDGEVYNERPMENNELQLELRAVNASKAVEANREKEEIRQQMQAQSGDNTAKDIRDVMRSETNAKTKSDHLN